MQLVVFEVGELVSRGLQGAAEAIVGPIHLIHLHDGAEAAFVEPLIVRYKRQTLYQRSHPRPHLGEDLGSVRVLMPKAVHPLAEPAVVIGFRLDEAVEVICHHSIPDNDHTHAAHTGWAFVGGLEVYGCEVFHLTFFSFIEWQKYSRSLSFPVIKVVLSGDSVATEVLAPAFGTVRALPYAVEVVGGGIDQLGLVGEDSGLEVAVVVAFHADAGTDEVGGADIDYRAVEYHYLDCFRRPYRALGGMDSVPWAGAHGYYPASPMGTF